MYNDIKYQLIVFFICILSGSVITVVFDMFRIYRRVSKAGIIHTFVQDILFWIIAAIIMFATSLMFNNGEVRLYMIVGVLLGGLIYLGTVSSLVIRLITFLLKFFKKITCLVLKILILPLKLIARLLHKPVFIVMGIGKRSGKKLMSILSFKLKKTIKFGFSLKILKKFKKI